jgi:hypothetical protein
LQNLSRANALRDYAKEPISARFFYMLRVVFANKQGVFREMRFAFALVLVGAALPVASTAGADPVLDALTPGPRLSEALERERSGVDVPWSKGVIRVERTFYRGQQPCRDYVWTRESPSGAKAEVRGTGCRVAKAKWETEEKPVAAATPPMPAAPALGSSTSPAAAPVPTPSGGSAALAPAKATEAPRPSRKPPTLTFTVPPRSDL